MTYTLIGHVGNSHYGTPDLMGRIGRWLVAGPDGKPAYYGESKQDALAWIASQRKRKKTKGKQAA